MQYRKDIMEQTCSSSIPKVSEWILLLQVYFRSRLADSSCGNENLYMSSRLILGCL